MVGPGAQDNVNQITVSIYGTINPDCFTILTRRRASTRR